MPCTFSFRTRRPAFGELQTYHTQHLSKYNSMAAAVLRVTKVRQFQKLADMSGRDGHLDQRLKQLLKLSKEKWDAACDHALTAVNVRLFLPVAQLALRPLFRLTAFEPNPGCRIFQDGPIYMD